MITDDQIKEWEEICYDPNLAPGPWHQCSPGNKDHCICGLVWSIPLDITIAKVYRKTDIGELTEEQQAAVMKFIAIARTALPALLSERSSIRKKFNYG